MHADEKQQQTRNILNADADDSSQMRIFKKARMRIEKIAKFKKLKKLDTNWIEDLAWKSLTLTWENLKNQNFGCWKLNLNVEQQQNNEMKFDSEKSKIRIQFAMQIKSNVCLLFSDFVFIFIFFSSLLFCFSLDQQFSIINKQQTVDEHTNKSH